MLRFLVVPAAIAALTVFAQGKPEITENDYRVLESRNLTMPLEGLSAKAIRDTFQEGRVGHLHEATDILAPRNTPIHAIGDGTIKKLFKSVPGGLTVYEYDPEDTYCYYYAHLDHYPEDIHEGMRVKRGDVIGYVGTTGDAPPDVPHLHLAILKLGPEKRYWQNTAAVNPYPILLKLAGK